MPEVSIIVTITRYWALEKLFECLDNLIVDMDTELILYLDTDDNRVINIVSDYMDGCKYNVKMSLSGNPAPSEVRIQSRRDRICENHERLKELVSGKYIFEVEDDTIFPANTLKELYRYIQKDNVGFIQGVQVGRWGVRMIGAWKVNNLYDPTKIITYPFTEVNRVGNYVEGIDAGGFYCYMTRADLFKDHKFTWHDDCFGPDVVYGLELKKKGYTNQILWNLICGHNVQNKVLYPNESVRQVEYNKINNKWSLK